MLIGLQVERNPFVITRSTAWLMVGASFHVVEMTENSFVAQHDEAPTVASTD